MKTLQKRSEAMEKQAVTSMLPMVLVSLLTGVTASILTSWFALHKDKTEKKQKAIYAAMRVAVILESFAMKCAKAIDDDSSFFASSGHIGGSYSKIPELEKFPDDINWSVMSNYSLSGKILGLINEINHSQWKISNYFDVYDGPMDGEPELLWNETGRCAYLALTYATELRRAYDLPYVCWKFHDDLKNHYKKANASH